MAKKTGRDGGWGPFERGGRYAEVEPGLGELHDAWQARTGKVALVLLPGEAVTWRFQGRWELRLLIEPEPPSMTLQVERAPSPARAVELADMLVLMTAAIQRVEDSPQLHAHLEEAPVSAPERERPRAGRVGRGGRVGALTGGAVLVLLGLGVWLHGARPPSASVPDMMDLPASAPGGLIVGYDHATPLAYPLPAKPFRDQVTAPCRPRLGEVEINKGCWLELAARPPCPELQAEYQGKCYLPSLKPVLPPQSVQP